MHSKTLIVTVMIVTLVVANAFAATYSIPQNQIDSQKVYFGKADAFNKPAEVDYDSIIKAAPEYAQIKREKIEKGSGKYWILLGQASERAVQTIAQVGKDSNYDLITASGYLQKINPAIQAENITAAVVAKISGKNTTDKNTKKS